MRLIDRICIRLMQRRYQVHIRQTAEGFAVDLPGHTLRAATVWEMDDLLEREFEPEDYDPLSLDMARMMERKIRNGQNKN